MIVMDFLSHGEFSLVKIISSFYLKHLNSVSIVTHLICA